MAITRDDVVWAYRFFLEREAENADVIDGWISSTSSTSQLRNGFLNSDEYRKENPMLITSMSGFEPAIASQVDTDLTQEENQKLFSEVKKTWTHLGDVDPYWAVLSSDEFHCKDSDDVIQKFYSSCSHLAKPYQFEVEFSPRKEALHEEIEIQRTTDRHHPQRGGNWRQGERDLSQIWHL